MTYNGYGKERNHSGLHPMTQEIMTQVKTKSWMLKLSHPGAPCAEVFKGEMVERKTSHGAVG